MLFSFYLHFLVTQSSLPVCQDVCISYYSHCGLDAEDSLDICQNVHPDTPTTEATTQNESCTNTTHNLTIPSLVSMPLSSLASLTLPTTNSNNNNNSTVDNQPNIHIQPPRMKTRASSLAMPIAVSSASVVMLISLIAISRCSF